uniref:Uncharacterized protein n=1 Tax=Triticum urartu TaxID=4572 RepID=A0A8R7QHB6_TRIUA
MQGGPGVAVSGRRSGRVRRLPPRGRRLPALFLEPRDAGPQVSDVGYGVGEEGSLVHAGHPGHGGAEVAEPTIQLVTALPLGLHVADGGPLRPRPGLPPTPLRRRCLEALPRKLGVRRQRGAPRRPHAISVLALGRHDGVADQPLLGDLAGGELEDLVVVPLGGGDLGRR